MTTTFQLRATFLDVGHQAIDSDVRFYRSLPNVSFATVNPQTGQPELPIPGPKQTVLTIVTAVLSSTALSQGIEAWLTEQPTRIEITVEEAGRERSLVFEGPNIKESRKQIDDLLNELSSGAGQCAVKISATKKPAK